MLGDSNSWVYGEFCLDETLKFLRDLVSRPYILYTYVSINNDRVLDWIGVVSCVTCTYCSSSKGQVFTYESRSPNYNHAPTDHEVSIPVTGPLKIH